MNKNKKTTDQKHKTKMTASTLMRLAGLSALVSGVCFFVMGMFHPVNVPASVTTPAWVNVHLFAMGMSFFGLFGMAGLYARQAEKAGWVGLAGFVLLSLWMGLVMPFSFIEAFILPHLIQESPVFVAGFLGMFSGIASEVDLGMLPTLWNISGPMYILGPLLFGAATFRAKILPRWASALLIFGSSLTPVAALFPPEWESKILFPIGIAMIGMGYALFAERRENATETLLEPRTLTSELGKAA